MTTQAEGIRALKKVLDDAISANLLLRAALDRITAEKQALQVIYDDNAHELAVCNQGAMTQTITQAPVEAIAPLAPQ